MNVLSKWMVSLKGLFRQEKPPAESIKTNPYLDILIELKGLRDSLSDSKWKPYYLSTLEITATTRSHKEFMDDIEGILSLIEDSKPIPSSRRLSSSNGRPIPFLDWIDMGDGYLSMSDTLDSVYTVMTSVLETSGLPVNSQMEAHYLRSISGYIFEIERLVEALKQYEVL